MKKAYLRLLPLAFIIITSSSISLASEPIVENVDMTAGDPVDPQEQNIASPTIDTAPAVIPAEDSKIENLAIENNPETSEPPPPQKLISIADFEKVGFKLGAPLKGIKCPEEISQCSQSTQLLACTIGNNEVCFSDEQKAFSYLRFNLESSCELTEDPQLIPFTINPKNENHVLSNEKDAAFTSTQRHCHYRGKVKATTVIIEYSSIPKEAINELADPTYKAAKTSGSNAWFPAITYPIQVINFELNHCKQLSPTAYAQLQENFYGDWVKEKHKGPKSNFTCHDDIERRIDSHNFYDEYKNAVKENNEQLGDKKLDQFGIEKDFTNKLLAEGRKLYPCPAGFKKTKDQANLIQNTYSVQCKTDPINNSKLCPKDTFPTFSSGFFVNGHVASNYCNKETCLDKGVIIGGAFSKQCRHCPAKTTYDATASKMKKDRYSETQELCKGSSKLVSK